MSSFKFRPRFKQISEGKKEDVEQRIVDQLKQKDEFVFNYLPGHLYIKIHPDEQHFWSPQLHLSFEQDEENVITRGLYGPKPTVWAIFFFSYVALGILSLFIGMWGLTKWSLGLDSTILWFVPGFAIIAIILYFFAQFGQKFGAQQMFDIHHFYESIIDDRVKVD